ncbi:hypothetical protein COO60DRAFT_1643536 [Scenedesmus sp. NREL 46B-D3]|nr:hypothetical protein COO60DRAFT_1643536 [Scenedesmus sp. NREL 46B-D3]
MQMFQQVPAAVTAGQLVTLQGHLPTPMGQPAAGSWGNPCMSPAVQQQPWQAAADSCVGCGRRQLQQQGPKPACTKPLQASPAMHRVWAARMRAACQATCQLLCRWQQAPVQQQQLLFLLLERRLWQAGPGCRPLSYLPRHFQPQQPAAAAAEAAAAPLPMLGSNNHMAAAQTAAS